MGKGADIERCGGIGWVARVWGLDIDGLVLMLGISRGKGGDDGLDSGFMSSAEIFEGQLSGSYAFGEMAIGRGHAGSGENLAEFVRGLF